MRANGRMSFFVKLAILTVICFCFVTVIKLRFEYNALLDEAAALSAQIEKYEDSIEKINSDLEHPFDDEYVVRIAREKLNYCMPEEIIFFNDH